MCPAKNPMQKWYHILVNNSPLSHSELCDSNTTPFCYVMLPSQEEDSRKLLFNTLLRILRFQASKWQSQGLSIAILKGSIITPAELVKGITKACPSGRRRELNPILKEWQSHITGEKLERKILLWPFLEDLICYALCYLIFQRAGFNSHLQCLCVSLPEYLALG